MSEVNSFVKLKTMTYQKEFNLSTKGLTEIIDLTSKVTDILLESKIQNGVVIIFITGSTAGITTLEYEPNLVKDFQEFIERLIHRNKKYHHNTTWGDDNGFSHLRASFLGPCLSIPVSKGKMTLGTWQQIILCDFDNRSRKRQVIVKIIGE